MAILAFQKPEKVIMLESTSSFGKFEFRPLEPGFGMTIGNALRRILLSSLEGYAITTVKVAGVDHEFAAIPGVMEGMIDIILNLKKIRFIRTVDNQDAEKVSVNVAGVTELTAGYISNYLSFFKVLNPELVICHLAPGTKMQITLTIGKGRGYVPAEENTPAECEFGTLPIDSIFTPIKNVKYSIENYRVEQKTDYEKLNLEITTDGSIHPKDALKEAAKILIQHFMLEFTVWISDILRPIFTVFLHLLHRDGRSHIGSRMMPLSIAVDSFAADTRFIEILHRAIEPQLINHRLPILLLDDFQRQGTNQRIKLSRRAP